MNKQHQNSQNSDEITELRFRVSRKFKQQLELICVALSISKQEAIAHALVDYVLRHQYLIQQMIDQLVDTSGGKVSRNIANLLVAERQKRQISWQQLSELLNLSLEEVTDIATGSYPSNEQLLALESIITIDGEQVHSDYLAELRQETFGNNCQGVKDACPC